MKRTLSVVTSLFLVFAFAAAQTSNQAAPSFKAETQLVVVPVLVTQKGEAVRGLTKADFTIQHEGKQEQVAIFEEIQATTAKVDAAPLPPGTVTNYASSDQRQDVVIVLLDYLNGSWASRAKINAYLTQLAQELSASHTPAAVMILSTKGLVQAHSFTTDMKSFVAAVQRLGTEEGRKATHKDFATATWANPMGDSSESMTEAAFSNFAVPQEFVDRIVLDRANMTEQALEQLAEAYRGIPGRKKLVWVSTGFPVGLDIESVGAGASAMAEFRIQEKAVRAWRALSNANISVYPVDSNGGENSSFNSHFDAANRSSSYYASRWNSGVTNTSSLMETAARTGGKLCTDNPQSCTKKAVADAPHYYMIGFYLKKEAKEKPGWHKLKVKIDRTDVDVRARQGFFVGDRPKDAPPEDKDQVLTALASPLDYTSVPLRLRWNATTLQGKTGIEYTVSSPPGGVEVSGEGSALKLDILAYVRPAGAAEGHSFPASLDTKLSPAQLQALNATGFQIRKQIPLAPGKYEIRVFVRDNVAAKIGTISTVIDVGN